MVAPASKPPFDFAASPAVNTAGNPAADTAADSPREATARQLRANRRNAKKSTGPRTSQGKARSAQNAITHGLFCGQVVLPGENGGAFLHLRNDFIRRLRPQDLLELSLVDRIVAAQWRLGRAHAAESLLHFSCGDELLDRIRDRFAEFKIVHKVTSPRDLLKKCIDDAENLKNHDDARDLYQEYLDLSAMAALREAGGVATLAIIARGNRLDPEESQDARGRDAAAFDRLSRYARHLQAEISRCLRDLTRLRQMDAQSRDLPESPFEEPIPPEEEDCPMPQAQDCPLPKEEGSHTLSPRSRGEGRGEGQAACDDHAAPDRAADNDGVTNDRATDGQPDAAEPSARDRGAPAYPASPVPLPRAASGEREPQAKCENKPNLPPSAASAAPPDSCEQGPRADPRRNAPGRDHPAAPSAPAARRKR